MTAIVFESLTGATGMGAGTSTMPALATFGGDIDNRGHSVLPAFLTSGYSYELDGEGVSSLPGFVTFGGDMADRGHSVLPSLITFGAGFDITPDVGAGWSAMPLFTTEAETFSIDFDVAESIAPAFTTRGSDIVGDWGVSVMPPFGTNGYDTEFLITCLFIGYQTAGVMTASIGYPREEAATSAVAATSVGSDLTIQARAGAVATTSPTMSLRGVGQVAVTAAAHDAAVPVWWLLAAADAVAETDATLYLNMVLEAADYVLAAGLAATQLDAYIAVAVLAEARDRANVVELLQAATAAEAFDEAALQRIGMLVEALTEATASDSAESNMRLVLTGESAAAASDTVESMLDAIAHAMDSGHIVGTVRISGEVYSVYAMTLAGASVSEYVGTPAGSLAVIGGQVYGASEHGIHRWDGDTDDGEDINARVRIGLSALGTQLMKSVPNAYVGYTSDGTLLFKVSTTAKGVKRTNVYKLNPVQKSVVSDNRFSIAKGLQSVYWDFEIANYEGADFDLDTVKVWRMPLTRRK